MATRDDKALNLEQLEDVNGGNLITDVVEGAVNAVDSVFNKFDDTLCKMVKDEDIIKISDDPKKATPTRLI